MKTLVPVQAPVIMKEMATSGLEPIKNTIQVQEVALEMELDTGATVSVMSLQQFRQLSSSTKIMANARSKETFVQPVGVAHVKVQYGQQRAELPIYIMREKGPPLLGRQWLQAIRLDWHRIFGLNRIATSEASAFSQQHTKLGALLDKYQDLFKNELGTITEERVELSLKENSVPKFVKARNVPFALQPAVEAELKKNAGYHSDTKIYKRNFCQSF